MNLEQAFELYCTATNKGTLSTLSNKIKEYLESAKDLDINKAFSVELLSSFFYKGDKSALGKYSALHSFYAFIHTEILKLSKQSINFPILQEAVINFDRQHGPFKTARRNKKGDRVFLDKEFNFSSLFLDDYYAHLGNDVASKTVKAAIAFGLGAGYDSGEMFLNNTMPRLKLNDPIINDSSIMAKNYSINSSIPYIEIKGVLAEYIKDYSNLRKTSNLLVSNEKEFFITKLWENSELNYDNSVEPRRPYKIQELVYYMLKYISIQIGLEGYLTVTDLRSNLVLHSLYNSKGAALKQIIKTFGFVPFVQEAFSIYCEQEGDDICSLFNDVSFFQSSPPDAIYDEPATGGEAERRGIYINKLIRDNKIVKSLKYRYENICQICGTPLALIDDLSYSEACHIQPLGGDHKGIDIEENMIILCPNHHKLFDLGFISIDPDKLDSLLYVDKNNSLHGATFKLVKHKISPIAVRYHYENIFLPLRRDIYGY